MLLNKNKKVFYRLLTSYILISAIPLLIMGAIFYYFNVVNLQKEIEEKNISNLAQATDRADVTLKELRDIARHLTDSSSKFPVASKNLIYTQREYEQEIISQLQTIKDNIPLVEDVLYYEKVNDYVYLSGGKYHYSFFESKLMPGLNWNQAGFFKRLVTILSPVIRRINPTDTNNPNGKLVYMFPVPYYSTSAQATISFIIKEADFFSMIDDFVGNFNGFTYVFDNKNSILLSRNNGITGIDMSEMEKAVKLTKGAGLHNIELNKRNFKVLRIISQDTGWSYVTVTPEVEFFNRVYVMRNIIFVTILVLAAFGLFSALFMSIRYYKPIKTMLTQITKQEPQLLNKKFSNEFDLILSTFDTAIKTNNELKDQMNVQRPMVKDQLLLRILKGKVKDTHKLEYLMKCSNVQLEGSLYFTIVLSINNINATIEMVDKALKLVEDFTFPGGRGYGVELVHNRKIVVFVSLKEKGNDVKTVQYTIAKKINSLLEENLNWKPIIGIGNPYSDILKMNTSFHEASAVIDDNLANYNTNIHFYCDMDYNSKQVLWYPITEQALFIQSLKQGDGEVALSALDTIVDKLSQKVTSYPMYRCLCYDIINSIIKVSNQLGLANMELDLKDLTDFTDLEDFKTRAAAFTVEFCRHIENFKENKRSILKKNIILYVKNNFNDSNLSLENVSSKFEISITYLSRLIKEETGVNFIDYITNLRMEKVKFDLKNTSKPIKDIVRDVGYIDPASFVRKFKSIEGITPGRYRELME